MKFAYVCEDGLIATMNVLLPVGTKITKNKGVVANQFVVTKHVLCYPVKNTTIVLCEKSLSDYDFSDESKFVSFIENQME